MKNIIQNNFEKFGLDENVLLITGLSGSGKSTLSKKLAAEYNAIVFELDTIEHYNDLLNCSDENKLNELELYVKRYFETNIEKNIVLNDKLELLNSILDLIFEYAATHKSQLFIFEGIQILNNSTYFINYFKTCPIIILNPGYEVCIQNRLNRDKEIIINDKKLSNIESLNYFKEKQEMLENLINRCNF